VRYITEFRTVGTNTSTEVVPQRIGGENLSGGLINLLLEDFPLPLRKEKKITERLSGLHADGILAFWSRVRRRLFLSVLDAASSSPTHTCGCRVFSMKASRVPFAAILNEEIAPGLLVKRIGFPFGRPVSGASWIAHAFESSSCECGSWRAKMTRSSRVQETIGCHSRISASRSNLGSV
jgi:hypothetical protein